MECRLEQINVAVSTMNHTITLRGTEKKGKELAEVTLEKQCVPTVREKAENCTQHRALGAKSVSHKGLG